MPSPRSSASCTRWRTPLLQGVVWCEVEGCSIEAQKGRPRTAQHSAQPHTPIPLPAAGHELAALKARRLKVFFARRGVDAVCLFLGVLVCCVCWRLSSAAAAAGDEHKNTGSSRSDDDARTGKSARGRRGRACRRRLRCRRCPFCLFFGRGVRVSQKLGGAARTHTKIQHNAKHSTPAGRRRGSRPSRSPRARRPLPRAAASRSGPLEVVRAFVGRGVRRERRLRRRRRHDAGRSTASLSQANQQTTTQRTHTSTQTCRRWLSRSGASLTRTHRGDSTAAPLVDASASMSCKTLRNLQDCPNLLRVGARLRAFERRAREKNVRASTNFLFWQALPCRQWRLASRAH